MGSAPAMAERLHALIESVHQGQSGQCEVHAFRLIQCDAHVFDEVLNKETRVEVALQDSGGQVVQGPARGGASADRLEHLRGDDHGHLGQARLPDHVPLDDRHLLEGRIYRLRTGYAWSQIPASRTSRLVSNVEAFGEASGSACMLRSSFLLTEMRSGETRTYAGWNGYRLLREGRDWRIQVKQINQIDCDLNLRNPSILL